jgi:DNA-binding FrmR family transcriptional regulator
MVDVFALLNPMIKAKNVDNKTQPHATHKAQINRLRRIEGQIRGLQKMVSEEKYCVSILTQFKSVHAALNVVEYEIMKKHVENCVAMAIKKGSPRNVEEKLNEIMQLIKSIQNS